ncbi:MAG: DNA methyltransferase [Nitrososphaerales archaeon]
MNDVYFFLHSGERVKLANAELRALVKSYYPDAVLQNLEERVSIVDGNIDMKQIASRATCIRYAGQLLTSSDAISFDPDAYFRKYRKFACKLINLSKKYVSMEAVSRLGKYVKDKSSWMQVSLDDPDIILLYIVTDNGSMVGFAEYKNGVNSRVKDLRNRPYFHTLALEAKLSRMMVNLTMAKENDLLLDPFCGTGSILLEAAAMKIHTIGSDISSRMCYGALENTQNVKSFILNCDALSLPLQTKDIDVIATDLPYGRSASTMQRASKVLLKEFVSFINDEMRAKRCCVMCKKGDEQLFSNVVEEYDIYEHKSLTRKLMVLCN